LFQLIHLLLYSQRFYNMYLTLFPIFIATFYKNANRGEFFFDIIINSPATNEENGRSIYLLTIECVYVCLREFK
jgi:hypothetical protein